MIPSAKNIKNTFPIKEGQVEDQIIMFTSLNQVENAPTPYSVPDACIWYFGKLQKVLIQVITPFVWPNTFSLLFQTA